jgi:xylulokinase
MSYDMKEVVAAGGSYKWLANTLFGEASEAQFETMNELAAAVPAGANGLLYLPYLLISTNPDPALERTGSFFGLTVSTTQGDLCRAVFEGTAYALREAADRMGRAGIKVTELRPTGGPTKSTLWNQITADVTNCPVLLPTVSEGAAYGAALLAGLGVGIFPMDDNFETLRSLVKLSNRFDPQPDSRLIYDRAYDAFCELARQTAGIAPKLRTAQRA